MTSRKRAVRRKTVAKKKTTKGTGTRTAKARKQPNRSSGAIPTVSGYQLNDDEIEQLLQSGENRGMLEAYFGEAEYAELTELARQASARTVRGGAKVLILPGIMGSKLGTRRKLVGHDTLWIDPIDIARGRLTDLALPDRKRILALGVMLFAYLKLKLRLRIAGFDAEFHPFDWRQSLDSLGKQLLERVKKEGDGTHVVAHSMGGLVARAALAAEGNHRHIGRFVMLGTPNHGSFVPVQALRATHPTVATLAVLDLRNDAEDLARKIFRTLPGLTQMLPFPSAWNGLDLYDPATWPTDAPAPTARLLQQARVVQDGLAMPDDRFFLVAGVNQKTTVGLRRDDGAFVYEESREGDGTVPLAFAELPGTQTYYIEESHGSLPNNGAVASAVIDLLTSGTTGQLPDRWVRARAAARRDVTEEELRKPSIDLAPEAYGPRERRMLLAPFVSPEARDGASSTAGFAPPPASDLPGPGYQHTFENIVVGRRRQHALDLRLARGSITEVDARAVALGLFRDVDPAGAAGAIDELLGGAVREFTTRRMFSGEVGDIFIMPTGRGDVRAESVLFAGLGAFDAFGPEVQEFVTENVIRTFVRTHVEDFATVLMGAASGQTVRVALFHQLRGYIRGLLDADDDHRLRRLTIVENDPDTYAEIKRELFRLTSTDLFEGVRVTLDEVTLREARVPAPVRRPVASSSHRLAYLIVGQTENEQVEARGGRVRERARTRTTLRAALLTAQSKAAILSGVREVALRDIGALQKEIEKPLDNQGLARLGRELAALVLEDDVARGLASMKEHHLVVIHDEGQASRLPWEILRIGNWAPAAEQGLSRRYSADDLSVAKWLEERRTGDVLEMLLVVNPTLDLDGADDEADRIKALFPSHSALRLTEIRGEAATHQTLRREFSSGRYDVLHYAGHAYFDDEKPSRSGILCHGDRVLSGAQLAGLAHLPALAFFNACEAGRTRGVRGAERGDDAARRKEIPQRIRRNVGLAEAFLRGGVANYVGTYWPVGDSAAEIFAATFYAGLIDGEAIGAALQAARKAVRQTGSIDWADYIHYGSYDFALKRLGR